MNERGNTLYGLDSFRPEWTRFVLPAAGNLILRKSSGEAEVRFCTVLPQGSGGMPRGTTGCLSPLRQLPSPSAPYPFPQVEHLQLPSSS